MWHKAIIKDYIILGGSASEGFDFKGLSGQIRQGADMMDSASALIKKITSTFGSNWFVKHT